MATQHSHLAFYLFLISFISSTCFGQASLPDSLLFVYQSGKETDVARISAIIGLGASSFTREHPDSLLSYYEDAARLMEDQGTANNKVFYTYYQGLAHYRANRFLESIDYFEQAKELAKMEQDTVQTVKELSYLGLSYKYLADLPEALENTRGGLLLFLSGIVENEKFITVLESHLCMAYMDYCEYGKSREYLMKSLEYVQAECNLVGEVKGVTNIGMSCAGEKNYEKSKEYYLRAYAVAQENGLQSNEGTILLNIGDCYFTLGDFPQAEFYIRRGLKVAEEENEALVSIRGTIQLAHLYHAIKSDSALYFAEKGLALARQRGDRTMEENSLEILYQLYEEKGDYQEALTLHKLWKLKLDTTYSETNERVVFESEAHYTYEKQKLLDQIAFDEEIAQLKLDGQAKFYPLLAAFTLLIVASVVVFQVRQNRSKKEKVALLHQIELIKERVVAPPASVEGGREVMKLDKEKIEAYLGATLGESAWNILNAIYEEPTVSNKEIAQQVFLGLEGVSSSLRRMYRSFEVRSESSKNLKVALVTKAIEISLDKQGIQKAYTAL